jgi:hypothetical protein
MNIKQLQQAKTPDEARQLAIKWQEWVSNRKMYMSELADWQEALVALALNWGLAEEFE